MKYKVYCFLCNYFFPTLQVESEEEFERVGGTATGGGTFWGLGSLLTQAKVLFLNGL